MWDIHALQERFYFDTHVIPIFKTATPMLIQRLKALNDPNVSTALFLSFNHSDFYRFP